MFAIRSGFPDCLLSLHSEQNHRSKRQIWTIIRNLPTFKYRRRPYSMAGITSKFSTRRSAFKILRSGTVSRHEINPHSPGYLSPYLSFKDRMGLKKRHTSIFPLLICIKPLFSVNLISEFLAGYPLRSS